MKEITCPVCSSKIDTSVNVSYLNTEEKLSEVSRDVFDFRELVFCENCGFGFVVPSIEQNDLNLYYKSLYRNSGEKYGIKPRSIIFDKFLIETRSLSQILLAKMFREFKKGDSFLDIGGGNGFSSHAVKNLCPGISLFVVEPDEHSRDFLQSLGVHLYDGFFSNEPMSDLDDRKFDCILMSHVLEHYNSEDIHGVLTHIKNLMYDNSIFVCEVPVEDVNKHLKQRNAAIPHLSHFSEKSFTLALENAGFEIKFIGRAGRSTEEWWNEQQKLSHPGRIVIFRKLISGLFPLFIKKAIRRIYKPFTGYSIFNVLSNRDFQYSSNGVYLRAVAVKISDTEKSKDYDK